MFRTRAVQLVFVAVIAAAFGFLLSHYAFSPSLVSAASPRYKIVSQPPGVEHTEQELNQVASQGWKLHSINGRQAIFEKLP